MSTAHATSTWLASRIRTWISHISAIADDARSAPTRPQTEPIIPGRASTATTSSRRSRT